MSLSIKMGFTRQPYRMWSREPNTGCLMREKESSNCSVHEGACLHSPDWCWSPGRLLEGCWISVYAGILKNLHLMPVSTAGLMNLPERGRASRDSFFHSFLCGLPAKRSRLRRGSLPYLDTLIKKNVGFS